METLVSLLQTPVNTILVVAGIALVFFTFFDLSKGSIKMRETASKKNWMPAAIGALLILGGLFYRTGPASPAGPTESPVVPTVASPAPPSATPPPVDTPAPTDNAAPTEPLPTPTASPLPLRTVSDNCIDERTWKVDSTDTAALTAIPSQNNCLNLTTLGIAAADGTLLLRRQAATTEIASGIFTDIGDQSTIEFKISISKLYIVYNGNPAYISFAITPRDNPMTGVGSGRFKLQVKDTGNSPLILYMLADITESTGTALRTQHPSYRRTYDVRLVLKGVVMEIYIDNLKLNETIGIPGGAKVFYIGYNLPLQAGVEATISDISVDGAKK